jgi:hypothetical protein
MPAKLREAKQRRPQFSREVLELFAELEAVPLRQKKSQTFKNAEHELARKLGLVDEYWTVNSVLDRRRSCHPPGYIANAHHARCRAVRKALLAELQHSAQQLADEKAFPAP